MRRYVTCYEYLTSATHQVVVRVEMFLQSLSVEKPRSTMATKDNLAFSDMFRSTPIQSVIVSLVPVLLAFGQLANSYFNGLSFSISVPFAIVMVLFAGLLTQHHFAQFRRVHLERNV